MTVLAGGRKEMLTHRARAFFPWERDMVRITRGASEFTLQLDPQNEGVLLRRKLDYQYPNQRARVSVRPADSGASWQYAGDWHTVGSNHTSFGRYRSTPEKGASRRSLASFAPVDPNLGEIMIDPKFVGAMLLVSSHVGR